jgi:hypothetical protein
VFHLTNGAKVNITGLANTASENSALFGGFAYLKGINTQMHVIPNFGLKSSPGSSYYMRPRNLSYEDDPYYVRTCSQDKVDNVFSFWKDFLFGVAINADGQFVDVDRCWGYDRELYGVD